MSAYGVRLRGDYVVGNVPRPLALNLVQAYHYAHGGANTATFLHGLFKADELGCLGVAWWIPPTKDAALATWRGDWRRVLALSRLVLVPEAPKNAASFLGRASIRLIRATGAWDCLVTYADQGEGHTGGIYKQMGWEELGLTEAEYRWVDEAGRMVARKAGARTRTVTEMAALGYRKTGPYRKHKFRLALVPEPAERTRDAA